MIAAITGVLKTVAETSITLDVPPMVYELLISAADSEKLTESIGEALTFSTLLYLEGDPNRGNLEPRLIGFITPGLASSRGARPFHAEPPGGNAGGDTADAASRR